MDSVESECIQQCGMFKIIDKLKSLVIAVTGWKEQDIKQVVAVCKPLSSDNKADIEDSRNSSHSPLNITSQVSQNKPSTLNTKTLTENEKLGIAPASLLLYNSENKEHHREKLDQSKPSSSTNKAYTENSKLSIISTLPLHENKKVTGQTVEPDKSSISGSKVDKENSKFSIISTSSLLYTDVFIRCTK